MSQSLWSLVLVLALVFFWAIGAYNRLVRLRAAVGTAFAALEPLLRERLAWVKSVLPPADPSPDAPASTLDESQTQAWARLGAAGDQLALALAPVRSQPVSARAVRSLAQAQAALQAAGVAVAPAEAGPALQAQWDRLRHQELPLTAAFNEAVRAYNAAATQFPAMVMARLCGFRPGQVLIPAEDDRP